MNNTHTNTNTHDTNSDAVIQARLAAAHLAAEGNLAAAKMLMGYADLCDTYDVEYIALREDTETYFPTLAEYADPSVVLSPWAPRCAVWMFRSDCDMYLEMGCRFSPKSDL